VKCNKAGMTKESRAKALVTQRKKQRVEWLFTLRAFFVPSLRLCAFA
jgi:hypothetical protein